MLSSLTDVNVYIAFAAPLNVYHFQAVLILNHSPASQIKFLTVPPLNSIALFSCPKDLPHDLILLTLLANDTKYPVVWYLHMM